MTGIDVENGRVTGVQTNRGPIAAGTVVACTAGWTTQIADMAGVKLPLWTTILQACVTEPVKPFLDVIIVSGQLHIYISQTDRGEFLMGSGVEPYPTFSFDGTLAFVEELATHMLELFPQLAGTRILRQWTGLCDMTPDFSPILGRHRGRRLRHRLRLGNLRLQGDTRSSARRSRSSSPREGHPR